MEFSYVDDDVASFHIVPYRNWRILPLRAANRTLDATC